MIFFRKAVLIIHGYAGGTYDLENLSNYLERRCSLDVYSFTLPGHTKLSLKTTKYTEWIEEAENMVELLKSYGYRKIYVVGHSMGGVIATYLATKYKCIKKVVLAAPAFDYMVSGDKISDKIKGGINMLKGNSTGEVITRFLKLPISSINEFKKLVENYNKCYLGVSVPVLIVHGDNDSVVPIQSSIDVYNSLKTSKKKFVKIEGATHDIFCDSLSKQIIEIDTFLWKY